ncbi:MAG: BlaI/MecI/CopY family transcriptional regulator [Acidobacteria bacterium]|nr:BlaI/MecI/CopY family transcriptional regulator [Acidobacteriota bacterium]
MAPEPRIPTPTDAEIELLNVLWRLGPSTVKEVFEALQPTKTVGYTTVLKQLQVMHRKRLVRRSERFRAHVYEPNESRERTRRHIVRSLVNQVFDGSAQSLIQSALAGRRIRAEELAEIRGILDDVEKGKK